MFSTSGMVVEMGKKVKISFNAKPSLAELLKEGAEKEDVTVTEYLTKLISNGMFIQETLDKKENIYVGKDINKLREVLFKN